MKSARGHKKRYFNLRSIQALTCQVKLHETFSSLRSQQVILGYASARESDDDPPPELDETLLALIDATPCHCCRVFTGKARSALRYSRLKKRPPCRCRHRNTGLAPPPSQLLPPIGNHTQFAAALAACFRAHSAPSACSEERALPARTDKK